MKYAIEFEFPRPDNPKEGKIAGLSRMMDQARKALRVFVESGQPAKRGRGRPRKNFDASNIG